MGCTSSRRSYSRYKRLINAVYSGSKKENYNRVRAQKFIEYAISNHPRLEKVAKYLCKLIERDLERKRSVSRIEVGLKITDELLKSCASEIRIFGSHVLTIIRLVIKTEKEELQILGVETFILITEKLDDETLFTRRLLDFLKPFTKMCFNKTKNVELKEKTNISGLKGLRTLLLIDLSTMEISKIYKQMIPALLTHIQKGIIDHQKKKQKKINKELSNIFSEEDESDEDEHESEKEIEDEEDELELKTMNKSKKNKNKNKKNEKEKDGKSSKKTSKSSNKTSKSKTRNEGKNKQQKETQKGKSKKNEENDEKTKKNPNHNKKNEKQSKSKKVHNQSDHNKKEKSKSQTKTNGKEKKKEKGKGGNRRKETEKQKEKEKQGQKETEKQKQNKNKKNEKQKNVETDQKKNKKKHNSSEESMISEYKLSVDFDNSEETSFNIAHECLELISQNINIMVMDYVLIPMFKFFDDNSGWNCITFVIECFRILAPDDESRIIIITKLLEHIDTINSLTLQTTIIQTIRLMVSELQSPSLTINFNLHLKQYLNLLLNKNIKRKKSEKYTNLKNKIIKNIELFSKKINNKTQKSDSHSFLIDKVEIKNEENCEVILKFVYPLVDHISKAELETNFHFKILLKLSLLSNSNIRILTNKIFIKLFTPIKIFSYNKQKQRINDIPIEGWLLSNKILEENDDGNENENESENENGNENNSKSEEENEKSEKQKQKKKKKQKKKRKEKENKKKKKKKQIRYKWNNIQHYLNPNSKSRIRIPINKTKKDHIIRVWLKKITDNLFRQYLIENNTLENYLSLFDVLTGLLNEFKEMFLISVVPMLLFLQNHIEFRRRADDISAVNFYCIESSITAFFFYLAQAYRDNKLKEYILSEIGDLKTWNKIYPGLNIYIEPTVKLTLQKNFNLTKSNKRKLEKIQPIIVKAKIIKCLLVGYDEPNNWQAELEKQYSLSKSGNNKRIVHRTQSGSNDDNVTSSSETSNSNLEHAKKENHWIIGSETEDNFNESEYELLSQSERDDYSIYESSQVTANSLRGILVDEQENSHKNIKNLDIFDSHQEMSKKSFQEMKEFCQVRNHSMESGLNFNFDSIKINDYNPSPSITNKLNKIDDNDNVDLFD
ncbi:hypothetical protein M0812_03598 [Anaeramoeba flamelloides]|uniref:Uncharacterized protein n=1 Tax=Anaeramoeba flamelloides TaxID=1746091 RepID=A0AAV8AFW3_9EUKA|nr:hypothetical protein M0812_03598 [Anaeramoeba flamelloides]